MNTAAERIQRCAQRPDDIHRFFGLLEELFHQCDWVIPFNGLSEIARSGQVMIHAPIEDKKFLSARYFYIDDPRHIDAGLADQESTGLDDKTSASKMRCQLGE